MPQDRHAGAEGPDVTNAIQEQARAIAAASSEDQPRDAGPAGPEHEATFGDTSDDITSDLPPPAYGDAFGTIDFEEGGLGTHATVASDGRVNINIDQKTTKLSGLLAPILRKQLLQRPEDLAPLPPAYIPPSLGGIPGDKAPPPPMNVVIHVVGSRGDVQPFVALGQVLKKTYGHRVRLATHPVFRDFVVENGLEFFSIGGDPAELMAFMVKNPGLVPGKDALRSGDIGKRRKGMNEIVKACWRSCFEAGDGTGPPVSNTTEEDYNADVKPFVCDAIIANPPSFAHVHIAEKLGCPLHLMFTMPWSPTQAFPHPLANIQSSNVDSNLTNFLSYPIVELLTWQGLGDIINRFREHTLALEPISLMQSPALITRLKIPYTYCWSPALIPKPKDWKQHISISGFYFLSLANNYKPADDLNAFLKAGPPPVYIGFGSIVLDDPNGMTKMIFEAVKKTGQRALVSKGWGGVGADELGKPDDVFMLGNVPHDWLFEHVSCVVHHGGAGTTAAGISHSKPTVVVPFFGDQPFWGAMISKAGAGPDPIHHKQLTAENLAEAIEFALKPETLDRAKELGKKISAEKGSDVGAKSVHDAIDVDSLRCSLAPSKVAVWQDKATGARLSGFAAAILGNEGLLDYANLRLFRYKEYESDDGPWEPLTGAASALTGTISGLMMGVADIPMDMFKSTKKPSTGNQAESSKSASKDGDKSTPEGEEKGDKATKESTPQTGQDKASASKPTESPGQNVSLQDMTDTGKGVGRIVAAGMSSPLDFTLALAKGFHNAPKLYGDTTVRPHERVDGFQSGLRAAGKEFAYGMSDGISGLVTQPMEGARKEGFAGLIKGFGKGAAGFILKPGAAFWGIPAYTWKGVWQEMKKHMGQSVQNYIIASRVAQGYDDVKGATEAERKDVIQRWNLLQKQPKKKWWQSQLDSKDKKKDTPIDQAIKQSVASTSTGNPEQDKLIQRAIQTSVDQLRQASSEGKDDEALEKAIKASVEVASKGNNDEDFEKQIAAAMQKSLQESADASVGSDDDDNIKEALRQSKIDPEMDEAVKKSLKDAKSQDDEDRIVLEYVKKQSLFEEEQQRKKAAQ